MKTILVIDDHYLIRLGIKNLIYKNYGSSINVLEAENTDLAQDLMVNHFVDLIILDINMPDKNGIEFMKELKEMAIDIPILILSAYPEEQYGLRAILAGASGYLSKNSNIKKVVYAINSILKGRKVISRKLLSQLKLR